MTVILCAVHLGGVLVAAAIPVVWAVRWGLWAALGWSLYCSLLTHAWRSGPLAIDAIELDNEGVASVRLARDPAVWYSARITSRFIHPWLTLMSLRLESRRWPVNLVIAADAVEPEPFRRWRVALKLQRAEG